MARWYTDAGREAPDYLSKEVGVCVNGPLTARDVRRIIKDLIELYADLVVEETAAGTGEDNLGRTIDW